MDDAESVIIDEPSTDDTVIASETSDSHASLSNDTTHTTSGDVGLCVLQEHKSVVSDTNSEESNTTVSMVAKSDNKIMT